MIKLVFKKAAAMNIFKKLDQQIDQYASDVDARNRSSFMVYSKGALIISIIIACASLFVPGYHKFLPAHLCILGYSAALYFWAKKCNEMKTADIRVHIYLSFVPFLIGAVLLGTYFDPGTQAVTIVIFLCILPLFIIDKPWRSALFQFLFAVIFVFMSYLLKPYDIFRADTIYLPIYFLLGIAANIFTLIERVDGVKNYVLLRQESERDALTRLLNRKSGEEKTIQMLADEVHGTFAIIDIDGFKLFNDQYGHQTGDDVLQQVSDAMTSVFRASDIVWRLGGDEFAIFAVDMTDENACRRRFATLMDAIANVQVSQELHEPITVSVGCTICRDENPGFEDVYRSSDTALYQAKKLGHGKLVFSQPQKKEETR